MRVLVTCLPQWDFACHWAFNSAVCIFSLSAFLCQNFLWVKEDSSDSRLMDVVLLSMAWMSCYFYQSRLLLYIAIKKALGGLSYYLLESYFHWAETKSVVKSEWQIKTQGTQAQRMMFAAQKAHIWVSLRNPTGPFILSSLRLLENKTGLANMANN